MGLFDRFSARRGKDTAVQGKKAASYPGYIFGGGPAAEIKRVLSDNPKFKDTFEAYSSNATVRACVDVIADAAASVPFVAYTGSGTQKAAHVLNMKGGGPKAAIDVLRKEQIDYGNVQELDGTHPIIATLLNPNPQQSRTEWIAAYVGYQLLAGDSFTLSTNPVKGGKPRLSELYFLNPDAVTIEDDGVMGGVRRYVYEPEGGRKTVYTSENVLHIKSVAWGERGVPVLASCVDAVNQNSMGRKWNTNLLANNGKPAAHANYNGEEGMDEETYNELLRTLNTFFSPQNNGKVILTTNTELKEWGLTPADMSWISSIQDSSREICKAFKIAPQILGDTSAQTYSNYMEARQSLYLETVIPVVERLTSALTRWYRAYDPTFLLIPNVDEIEALTENINDRFTRANAAQFLTIDERRMQVGYEPIGGEEGKTILVQGAMTPLELVVAGAQWGSLDMTVPGTGTAGRIDLPKPGAAAAEEAGAANEA